jgi:hypothetical protein
VRKQVCHERRWRWPGARQSGNRCRFVSGSADRCNACRRRVSANRASALNECVECDCRVPWRYGSRTGGAPRCWSCSKRAVSPARIWPSRIAGTSPKRKSGIVCSGWRNCSNAAVAARLLVLDRSGSVRWSPARLVRRTAVGDDPGVLSLNVRVLLLVGSRLLEGCGLRAAASEFERFVCCFAAGSGWGFGGARRTEAMIMSRFGCGVDIAWGWEASELKGGPR